MKIKIALALALAAVSGAAMAEWVPVSGNDTTTMYVDPATIRRSGHFVKMWRLMDFKSARPNRLGEPYLSSKAQEEFDCREERNRLLYLSWHSGNMGEGNIVFTSNKPQEWEPVPPGALIEDVWKVACGKK